MKKSIIKVTVALGIVLGGMIPFSFVPGVETEAVACGDKDKSAESTDTTGNESN